MHIRLPFCQAIAAEDLALGIALERDMLVDSGARVAGALINRVRPGFLEYLSAALEKNDIKLLGHLPRDKVLAASRFLSHVPFID